MTVHQLKTWPEYFAACLDGSMPFQIRRDDRESGFAVGDKLNLREWDPKTREYTGRSVMVRVVSIIRDPFTDLKGFCVMGTCLESRRVPETVEEAFGLLAGMADQNRALLERQAVALESIAKVVLAADARGDR